VFQQGKVSKFKEDLRLGQRQNYFIHPAFSLFWEKNKQEIEKLDILV
jgi:hypothetical protein